MSSALAGRFFTIELPGKPCTRFLILKVEIFINFGRFITSVSKYFSCLTLFSPSWTPIKAVWVCHTFYPVNLPD